MFYILIIDIPLDYISELLDFYKSKNSLFHMH